MLRKTVSSFAAFGVLAALAVGGAGAAQAAPEPAETSAIVNSGPNFLEPDGSVTVNGRVGECEPVRLNTTGSIQFLSGPKLLTLWTGADCKTGLSLAITENQSDLAAAHFGKTVSIYIGDNEQTEPGTTVLLGDDRGNPDVSATQSVVGEPGECVPVSRRNVASSAVRVDGVMTLWSGQDCTGDSVEINGDVPDLAAVDFDDRTVSVRFGG